MQQASIGIAGAGLLGRLAAWRLAWQGHDVSVFDPAPGPEPLHDGQGAAGFTAAGMLSPLAERETASAELVELGWRSIGRWQRITERLSERQSPAPSFAVDGSLLVAHGADLGSAQRVLAHLQPGTGDAHSPRSLGAAELATLEPALHSAQGSLHAWWLPGEAHIDTVRMLQCLHADAPSVRWHWESSVSALGHHWLDVNRTTDRAPPTRHVFDWVLDLRGTGAREACAVRGVRGEMVWLHAPGLGLRRPVRLLHPRHRVYIVPRPGDVVLVGASEIESEDRSPVSLRSAVELMAAAHSLLPALAEARIVRLDSNLRPALPDNQPTVHHERGLIRINGLYRHGWLLAPELLERALTHAGLVVPGPEEIFT